MASNGEEKESISDILAEIEAMSPKEKEFREELTTLMNKYGYKFLDHSSVFYEMPATVVVNHDAADPIDKLQVLENVDF